MTLVPRLVRILYSKCFQLASWFYTSGKITSRHEVECSDVSTNKRSEPEAAMRSEHGHDTRPATRPAESFFVFLCFGKVRYHHLHLLHLHHYNPPPASSSSSSPIVHLSSHRIANCGSSIHIISTCSALSHRPHGDSLVHHHGYARARSCSRDLPTRS